MFVTWESQFQRELRVTVIGCLEDNIKMHEWISAMLAQHVDWVQ